MDGLEAGTSVEADRTPVAGTHASRDELSTRRDEVAYIQWVADRQWKPSG